MTGYGKATAELPDKKINVEIKSLNSKAMDLSTRIAPAYREKEIEIRNEISKVLERGKADFSLWIEKKEGADAAPINKAKESAKKMGIEFISKRLPEIFEQVQELSKKYSKLVFMCARGGMRSSSITSLFGSLGYKVAKLEGGYKAYRDFILNNLPIENEKFKYIVIHGRTGVGKTKILNKMIELGVSVMDLEKMAAHKGSFFGALGEELPQNQKRFDGEVFEFLRTCKTKYIVVESESKRIGNLYVPESVYTSMTNGRHLFIDTSISNRLDILLEDYTKVSPQEIEECIMKVARYVSKEKTNTYLNLLHERKLKELGELLIVQYYDPLYEVSIDRHEFELSIKYEDMDKCAKELSEYFFKLENEENNKKELA